MFGLTLIRTSELKRIEDNVIGLNKQITQLKEQINYSTLTFPEVKGTVTYRELYNILCNHSTSVFVSDNIFNLTDLNSTEKFILDTKVQFKTYLAENHDCDNFSFELMGYFSQTMWSYVFGIAWSGTHAFNFFLDEKKQLYVVEPQTGVISKIEDIKGNKLYYPWRIALC